ncbi:MAG: hypothetical protein CL878_03000 [Dehalococcoidia bacterium]|nr:hypothetical protein [Dehalococcoidia bacterium]
MPHMVPLAHFGELPHIDEAPINWQRRAFIGCGLAVASGALIAGLAWMERVAGWHYTDEELGKAASGERGVMTVPGN